jgi:phosphocarrier protein HPr
MLVSRKQNSGPNGSRVSREFVVPNKLGIHARPAALFVKTATKFDSDITVEKDGEQVNGKSIMGLMMLAASKGAKLIITAEGHDAETAIREMQQLFDKKFNED